MRRTILAIGGAAAVLAGALTAAPALATPVPAARVSAAGVSQSSEPLKLTLVARWCPDTPGNSYANVRANRARNNIMESLKNLGPDSNYNDSMNPPVGPDKEDAPPQDVCQPLLNFPITLGDRIDGKAALPVNGQNQPYLSQVGGVNGTYRTEGSVPELDRKGNPTGRSIAGATTLTLSQTQAELAGKNSLWVMGGTRANGLGDELSTPPGSKLKFAGLRCAVDALNGDNVEYVGYRNQDTHAFCYALYISDLEPPPTPGVIEVIKDAPGAGDLKFQFQGDISFNPGGQFDLKDGQKFSETRAPGTWYVQEASLPQGWRFASASCTVTGDGGSTWELDGRRIDIELKPGDKVSCTYANQPIPPEPGTLTVAKTTTGGTGTFDFSFNNEIRFQLTTTDDQGEVPAEQDFTVPPAPFSRTIMETVPTDPNGTWQFVAASCVTSSHQEVTSDTPSITIAVPAGGWAYCTFSNRFIPNSDLIIRAKTYGGTDPAINYLVPIYNSETGDCDIFDPYIDQNANTQATGPGAFATAVPQDDTLNQPARTYCIAGTRPTEGANPAWQTRIVECTGDIDYDQPFNTNVDFASAIVAPTPGGTVTCDFVYVKRATLEVTKKVTAGNDLRTGPVQLSVVCEKSRAAQDRSWPKLVTLAPGQTEATLSEQNGGPVYLEGDLQTGDDTCRVTETKTGDTVAPGSEVTIAPKWKGKAWPSGTRDLGFDQTASLAGATASNGSPVLVALTSGDCRLRGVELTARSGSGQCQLKYEAQGNPGAVSVDTAWTVTSPDLAGSGTQAEFAVAAGSSPKAAFTNAYRRSTPTVSAQRTVNLTRVSPEVQCDPTKPRPNGETTVVDCGKTTSEGQKIRYRASCVPLKAATAGERLDCKVRVTKRGAVKVRTYGNQVRVTVIARAKKTADAKGWKRKWTWVVR